MRYSANGDSFLVKPESLLLAQQVQGPTATSRPTATFVRRCSCIQSDVFLFPNLLSAYLSETPDERRTLREPRASLLLLVARILPLSTISYSDLTTLVPNETSVEFDKFIVSRGSSMTDVINLCNFLE